MNGWIGFIVVPVCSRVYLVVPVMLFPCFGIRDGAPVFVFFFGLSVVFLLDHRDEVVFQVCCVCYTESIIYGPLV